MERLTDTNMVKVNSLEIIVRMIDDKPYYEVKYREVGKKEYSIGYSSYSLKTVLGFIDEYFEIVESKEQTNADRIRNMSDEELAESIPCPYIKTQYDECVHGWHDYDCNKCKLEWLQSEAE